VKLTRSRSFRTLVQLSDVRDWQDNGFGTEEAQQQAHGVLERAAAAVQSPRSVLDMGCGNGALLARLGTLWPEASLHGIELDEARARRGRIRHPHMRIDHGDFLAGPDQWVGPYDLIVIMPGRLIEADGATRATIRDLVMARTGSVLVYAYGDWLDRYPDLESLCDAAGLTSPETVIVESAAAAGVLSHRNRGGSARRATAAPHYARSRARGS
jgi:hypothetical protein